MKLICDKLLDVCDEFKRKLDRLSYIFNANPD